MSFAQQNGSYFQEESGQLLAVLRKLNPDARVLEIEHGRFCGQK
jgi:hypothetical protein